MNMCIQAAVDETLMLPMGVLLLLSFYFLFVLYTVMFHSVSSVYNYNIFIYGVPLSIFHF